MKFFSWVRFVQKIKQLTKSVRLFHHLNNVFGYITFIHPKIVAQSATLNANQLQSLSPPSPPWRIKSQFLHCIIWSNGMHALHLLPSIVNTWREDNTAISTTTTQRVRLTHLSASMTGDQPGTDNYEGQIFDAAVWVRASNRVVQVPS